jgi:hypothetical protein
MTCQSTNNCSTGKFKRLNYYHGMLLTEKDFQDEQTYFREKMKLHNRLHGYGVVWGLEIKLKCIKNGEVKDQRLCIEPGFALDCEGNEIIVCNSYLVPIAEKIEQLKKSCEPLKPCTKLFIAIKYCECKSAPQAQYTSGCGDDEQQFSRICEGFSVEVLLEDEVPVCCKNTKAHDCCEKPKQDCPGFAVCCVEEHVLILGCVYLTEEGKSCPDCSQYKQVDAPEDEKHNANYDKAANQNLDLAKALVQIDPCCKPRRICKPCPTPQQKWEQQKQKLIHEACIKSGRMIDISGVVGKSVCDAESYLKEIGCDKTHVKCIDVYKPEELHRLIEKADCYIVKGQSICLITDQDHQCVLFALCDEHKQGR